MKTSRSIGIFLLTFLVIAFSFVSASANGGPEPICFYTWYQGAITDAEPIQEFIFDATGARYITVTMKATSGDLDPFIEVYDEDTGDRVANATNIWLGPDRVAKIFNLPVQTRNYIIAATRLRKEDGSTSGGFSLYLDAGGPEEMYALEGNVTGGGTLFDGDIVEGYLRDATPGDNWGEGDRWYFAGNASDVVTVNLTLSKSLRAYTNEALIRLFSLELYLADNETLAEKTMQGSDDSGTELVLFNQRLGETERYVITVSIRGSMMFAGDVSDDEQFAYQLELLGSGGKRPEIPCAIPIAAVDLANPPFEQLGVPDDTLVLNNVGSGQDEISDDDVIHNYVFAANGGDLVSITMTRTSGDLLPLIGVQNVNGELLDREPADLSGRRAVMNFLVSNTGWYAILATREDVDEGTSNGAYLLEFEGSTIASDPSAVPPPDIGISATVVQEGQIIEDTISDENHILYYLISAQRDDNIMLEMRRTTGDLDPFVAVLDTDLSVLVRGQLDLAGRTSSLTFTVPNSGWYVIAATRENADTGTTIGEFTLRIN